MGFRSNRATRLPWRDRRSRIARAGGLAALAVGGALLAAGCYDTGDGSTPPIDAFYFPVGLQVSHGGTVLYAVNSNFDLQYNGGTLQSYDLRLIRRHALLSIANPADPTLPLIRPGVPGACPSNPPVFQGEAPSRQPLGETCAPPVDSRFYFRDSAVIGAFATELLLSKPPAALLDLRTKQHADDPPAAPADVPFDRLFAPVRGNATLTWATVERDTLESAPNPGDTKASYPPFRIDCGQSDGNRCDALHLVGEDPNEKGNTRHLTLPGEPFAAAISEDGQSLVMTHQNETKTSLFSTALARTKLTDRLDPPVLEFVADNVPVGGVGITPVPHDLDAFLGQALPRPAFFQTSRVVPEVSLIRQYTDQLGGTATTGSSLSRPFLNLETAYPVSASASGTDSRSIVIDPTPRLACKARVSPSDPDRDAKITACARKPARAFITNRSPAALLIGDVGANQGFDGAYNPDRLTLHTSVPLAAGPSKAYLAPIVDRDGAFALRVFIVCFDAAQIYIYDPDGGVLENILRVGPGPFAMTFDPFSLEEVATHSPVEIPARDADVGLRRYRFAYLASFTQSYVQVIDLDNASTASPTFERVVYTLGQPTNPKGT